MKLFLSYRRDDSRAFTERVYDRLAGSFGKTAIFKDVDSIPAGGDFRAHLSAALNECQVLLCVIGSSWLDIEGPSGGRRLADPGDYVRLEIETAIGRDIPIIPVLADATPMVRPDDLPPTLQPLAFRQAVNVRTDPDFDGDVERLIKGIRRIGVQAPVEAPMESSAMTLPQPLRANALLDRRLATEIVVLFSRPGTPVVLDPRLPALLAHSIRHFDQLLVENQYGSTLFQVLRKEEELLRDSICMLHSFEPPAQDRDSAEMQAEAAEYWSRDPQFQIRTSQYDRTKGGALGAIDENIAYMQRLLLLARQFDAAIIPHPDRWPLLRWIFANSITAAESPSSFEHWVPLSTPVGGADPQMPAGRAEQIRALADRLPGWPEMPMALVRYLPMHYPFPQRMLRHYARADLVSGAQYMYEFLAPQPADLRQA